ncbi:hypothetical protein OUZ56_005140 [Daphnia magna]|uniref:Uncharacterized protein n=1 Tax=Daphnia magna TaxID=35525 RepID=A0ABQ9YRY0_9CRUS|nr:hypothetical protein OUZ56_005140 [Daphnia magna]
MVLLIHGDSVDKVAKGLRCIAKCLRHIIFAIADTQSRLYGVQFHDLTDKDEKCCITSCSTFVDCKELSHWRNASSSVSITSGVRDKATTRDPDTLRRPILLT